MEKVKLIDICNPKQWPTLSTNQLKEDGEYLVYGANGIIGHYDQYNHEEETVLITCRGATCGNIHISKEKSYVNGNAMALDNLKEEKCLKKYLYYFLKQYDMKKIISGSAQPQITIQGLRKVEIVIFDLEQQIRIIETLDRTQEIIETQKKQMEALDELIKALFVKMFGDIEEYERLEEYSILITKGASPRWQGVDYKKEGTLFITSENVKEGYVDITKPKYLDNKINEILPRSVLKKEDILINIVGASIGRAGKYDYGYLANINQAVALVRTKNINNTFLLEYLNSEQAIKMYNDMKKGGARENLSLKNIADLKIPIPPIQLQNQFASIVNQINEQKNKMQKNLQETKELQKSLMNQYFN